MFAGVNILLANHLQNLLANGEKNGLYASCERETCARKEKESRQPTCTEAVVLALRRPPCSSIQALRRPDMPGTNIRRLRIQIRNGLASVP
jgi:hypothetical protein